MATSIQWTDGIGSATLDNQKPAPGDRFAGWTPTTESVGPKDVALGTGRTFHFNFRTDYLASFELQYIPNTSLELAQRLKRHLETGGTCVVNTGDRLSHSYTVRIAPGTRIELVMMDDRRLLEYVFRLRVKHTLQEPLVTHWEQTCETLVASDGFEYATTGALDDAWPATDTMGGPTTWSIDTVVVQEGTYAAKGEFPYTGGPGDSYRARTFTGLLPNTLHIVRLAMWINREDQGSVGLATGLEVVGGTSNYTEADGLINNWVNFEAQGLTNGAGELTVRVGWFGALAEAGNARVIRIDDLTLYRVGVCV